MLEPTGGGAGFASSILIGGVARGVRARAGFSCVIEIGDGVTGVGGARLIGAGVGTGSGSTVGGGGMGRGANGGAGVFSAEILEPLSCACNSSRVGGGGTNDGCWSDCGL